MGKQYTEAFEGVEAVRETEKALLVRLADGEEKWLPKSAIHDDSEVWELEGPGNSGTLVVHVWFINKTGWPDDTD